MARLRAGVPITYNTSARGSSPYKKKVMMPPSSVPVLWVASATAMRMAT